MISEDMDEVLRAYFAWARQNAPDDIGYPHIDPVRRLLGSGIGQEGLSDDEAIHIDQAMALLRNEDKKGYEVTRLIYRDGRSIRWLETRGHGDRKSLARAASESRHFIRGVLFGMKIMEAPPATVAPESVPSG